MGLLWLCCSCLPSKVLELGTASECPCSGQELLAPGLVCAASAKR